MASMCDVEIFNTTMSLVTVFFHALCLNHCTVTHAAIHQSPQGIPLYYLYNSIRVYKNPWKHLFQQIMKLSVFYLKKRGLADIVKCY